MRCNAEVDRRALLAGGSAAAIAGVPNFANAANVNIDSDEWEVVRCILLNEFARRILQNQAVPVHDHRHAAK